MEPDISLQTIIVRAQDHFTTALEDEIIVMNVIKGNYYGAEGTAKRIWEYLEKPILVADLVTALAIEYGITEDECRNDVLDFIKDLSTEGLAVVQKSS